MCQLSFVIIAMQLYVKGNNSRYPPVSGSDWISFNYGGGDPDPLARRAYGLEWATNRLLWPYTASRKLFCCPADRGMNFAPDSPPVDNNYEMAGTSYKYNEIPWPVPLLLPIKNNDRDGLAGKKEDWLSQPSRYALLHEPSATPNNSIGTMLYFFWHYARGPNTVDGDLSKVVDRFISAVQFADGHSAQHDFTRAITLRRFYPCEATPDWYFYEPARGSP
jgi:hypothetical protein